MRFLFVVLFLSCHLSFASGSKKPDSSESSDLRERLPRIDRDLTPVHLDPEVLKKRLFDENIDIRYVANGVHRAKEGVNLARANLFPSLQLGALIASLANPSFIFSSVEALLPFLMPSRWFDLFQAENLLEVDKKSYHLLQLNSYSSAYSMLVTIANDILLLEMIERDLADWRRIEEITEIEYDLGSASDNDLSLARGQRALAAMRVKGLEALIVEHKANLRSALGYHSNRPIHFISSRVNPSAYENSQVDDVLPLAFDRAVEREQIDYLTRAAKSEKWSRIFSFIGGVSVSSRATAGESLPSFAFDKMQVGGSLSFSFGQFPLVRLADINVREMELRRQELARELMRVLEVALRQYPLILARFRAAEESENMFRRNFDNNLRLYELGEIAFRDLLISRLNITEATTGRLRAQTDVDLTRITLHRTFRTAQFESISGCQVPNTASNRKKHSIPDSDHLSYCLNVNP